MSSQSFDPHLAHSIDQETSSLPSDTATTTTPPRAAHSDEEVLLATSRPKKKAGRRVFKETRHPIYRGVRKRNNNKWVCELREPIKKSRIWLGTYPNPEMAARAHDVAALALRGKSACLNFADSAWKLPVPSSTEPKEIMKAAREGAQLCHCPDEEFGGGSGESKSLEKTVPFVDEEEVFDMPGLLVDMAEGLLLSPPHISGDDFESGDSDASLWNYSI